VDRGSGIKNESEPIPKSTTVGSWRSQAGDHMQTILTKCIRGVVPSKYQGSLRGRTLKVYL
jgi:hypothetical protein